jgi:hypothetical protein
MARGLAEVLSADSLEGRKTGQRGGARAEAFAAARFQEWGVHPGVADTSYFQPYTFLSTQIAGVPELVFPGAPPGDIRYAFGADFAAPLYAGSGTAEAEVVFVGYGISAPDKGHDDYAGVDVQGRIVLFMRGAPRGNGRWEEERANGWKVRAARAHGAKGALMFEGDRAVLGTVQERYFVPDMPSMWVALRVVRDLFTGAPRPLSELRPAMEQGRNVSFAMGRPIRMSVESRVLENSRGRNVVGRIPGSDAALRKECVVIGAHLDHLGRDALGRTYPGADDNASGAATVLEMARTVARGAWRPRRTVYFALFGCEEQGLQGSTWFAEHPPAESIAVMLNLDMVGVGEPVPNFGGVDRWPELVRLAKACLPDSLRARSGSWGTGADSDHWPFSDRGIPSLFTASGGEHPDYHQPEDLAWKLRREVFESVGRFEMRVLRAVADTSLFRVDNRRLPRLFARVGRPVARARFDDGRRALREAAALGAGVVLLALPATEPLQTVGRVAQLERELAADSSAMQLARSADDLDEQARHGRVSVVLEARVGSFDLADSTLLMFLQRMGVRAVVPESAPTAAEARRIAAQGLLLDQSELRSPAAVDVACLYQGHPPRGAANAFGFLSPEEIRPGEPRTGCLLTEDAWRTASRLIKRKWTRDQAAEALGLNFVRFWKGVH